MKKLTFKTKFSRKRLITAGLILAGVLVLAQAAFDAFVYFSRPTHHDDTAVTNLIIAGVEDLYRPAAVEGRSGRIYFPEAKIVLPPSDKVHDLRFYYDDFSRPAELRVTTNDILSGAEAKLWMAQANSSINDDPTAVFDQVPNLQACARGVLASFGPPRSKNDQLSAAGRVKLNDGRQIYLYTENNCHGNLKAVADYLEKAQSY